jgi:hypothetical protein
MVLELDCWAWDCRSRIGDTATGIGDTATRRPPRREQTGGFAKIELGYPAHISISISIY